MGLTPTQILSTSPNFCIFGRVFRLEYVAKIQNFCIPTKFISEKMNLFQRLLSKDEINSRFVRAVYAIISAQLVNSKTALAESLGVKPAKFSEILNGRMKAGTDMLAILCDFYKVSPDWLLMSRGSNVFREDADMPKYWVDDDDLTSVYPSESKNTTADLSKSASSEPLITLIREKDDTIREQAEEIGRLKEYIRQLTVEKEKHVSPADIDSTANVG